MTTSICLGCGGQLQNHDPQQPYYTPKAITETTICQRCYRLKHYHEAYQNILSPEAYNALISEIAALNILVVMVVDIFDLEGSSLAQIHKLTGHNDVLVLVNKRDLLPKSVSDQKLRHRIKKRLSDIGIKTIDVLLVSALKKQNIDEALALIDLHSRRRDIYVVGATNVGKSTLINAFIQAVNAELKNLITVSNYRGTTQAFIPIAFENQVLYDTPGLYNKNHISEWLNEDEYQSLVPKKEIKPIVFQIHEDQALFVSGLSRFEIKPKARITVTLYAAPTTPHHRRKLTDAALFHEKHLGGLLKPPSTPKPIEFSKRTFKINDTKTDIVIPGLAILTFKGACDVTVYLPKTLIAYEREALI